MVRANPVENRNVFFLYLGMKGGGAGEMWVAPRSQSSICTKRDSPNLVTDFGGG